MKDFQILYDTFNARHISHAEVAQTFVSNPDLSSIATNSHTVVLGPRGSGKTTLFKMLTTPALKNWKPKTVEDILLRDNIPFLAIYIPSDELWKNQLEGFREALSNKPELIKAISNALITTNILSNFCKSIKEHIELTYERDIKKEFEFAKNLNSAWKLTDSANSLGAIRQSLEIRKNDLIAKIEHSIFLKNADRGIEFQEYFFFDYLKSIQIACIAFERIYNSEQEIKWALCFDELELVSKEFFNELISKLRIAPSNILLKLSAGPLVDFHDTLAQLSHDFKIVKLWPYNSDQELKYQSFCEDIAIECIKRKRESQTIKRYAEIDLFSIFGDLDYNGFALKDYNFKVDINALEKEPNSITWHAFKKLAESDPYLVAILEKSGINSENPIPRTQKNYDTIIRKLKEIVINRLVFRKFSETSGIRDSQGRSRKVFPIYYGKSSILKICEGNPRFMIGMITDMFSLVDANEDIADVRIKPIEQVKMIKDISDRFMTMLQLYPSAQKIDNAFFNLEWLITLVGNYFERHINEAPFRLKPATCFYVNDDLPREISELLKIGVDLGAFIRIDESSNLSSPTSKQSRYRLSYLLAPQFKLPIRIYGAINLMSLINSISPIRRKDNKNQLNLDMGYED